MRLAFRLGPVAILIALATSGCANLVDSDSARTALTRSQRDSVIATSEIPGAGVVGRALQESERASQHAASMDSLAQ